MNFSRFLDIQSWWEVPSIAYFCSLFRTAFNLLDFDIEELEEALLTDGTEESASSLLTELIVRLLKGCLGNNEISAFNYQMYLRRLFRQKCQDTGKFNPFNDDIDFQFLPLRTKVEILYALCDFRLDAEDVFDLFRNLEAESLRVEPLGWDDNDSAYWYFYGTRLYREDIIRKSKGKSKRKKKETRKRGWFYGDDWLDDEDSDRVWQVVCFTEEDWNHLTNKFRRATTKVERELHRSLSQNFLPEIPRLFQEKERLQRKRLLELAPRRTSSRVLQKIKQKEEETKHSSYDSKDEENKESPSVARENRARRRNQLRSKSSSSDSSVSSVHKREKMPQKVSKKSKNAKDKRLKNSSSTRKGEPPPEPIVKTGRKTNNSLAAATGQIVIPDNVEPVNSTRKKLKTSQIFSQTDEDIQTDMYKVLEQLTAHEDAWPFMDPVEEEYAPNYYAVIRRPMDLRKMEERLDSGHYTDFSMFKADFKLIVNNCRLYNGQDNEYTIMVDKLQAAFERLTEKYIHRLSSSDEEIAVEYQLPTPSRKHKLKTSESPARRKRKKRTSHSDTGVTEKSSSPEKKEEEEERKDDDDDDCEEQPGVKSTKESHRSRHERGKKKRKGHKRHGKHSKNHKRNSHKSSHGSKRHSRKHGKNKDKEGKKSKQKKKKSKHHDIEEPVEVLKRSVSQESLESSNRGRSASPLPSIHTPSPSPTELEKKKEKVVLPVSNFFKDKYDKIKERRRHAAKNAWESLFDFKQKTDIQTENTYIPEKNQKLRETIEKLKAKNQKYKHTSLFNSLFTPGGSVNGPNSKKYKGSSKEDETEISEDDTVESVKEKPTAKKGKKSSTKNASASEALEQAVKDISKWLDDAPKPSTVKSPCTNDPPQVITIEEQDIIRIDDESSQGEKSTVTRKDKIELSRKRPSSREPKLVKRREIQRTIERLQPGKSKGNLLTNISNKNTDKAEDVANPGTLNKIRDSQKGKECSPKLSLGSVLPTVEFTLGNDHNFNNETNNIECRNQVTTVTQPKDVKTTDMKVDDKPEEKNISPTKKDAEVETDPQIIIKPSQEKATPNLSAWFKAFGAPKTTNAVAITKKKIGATETEEKPTDAQNNTDKKASPKNTTNKYDSPNDLNSPIPDGGDSPIRSVTATPRQRRTSTGSSISERSSFSQDLDSPRHQMSHTSPLLRSPASPRTDDFQKITYPIINGTVRAGFYHDTTSVRSSPEKSCSPRDAPQSPYSPYSPHVYASNNNTGSATPNYFVDHNKSPLPTYGQNAPPYYDTSKAPLVSKPPKVHEDYTSLGPDSFQQNNFNGPFSPTPSPYPPTQSNYSQPQISPQPGMSTSQPVNTVQILPDPKTSLFPVKKRTYNEPEVSLPPKSLPETKDTIRSSPIKNDYVKNSQSLHAVQTMPSTSVDDIALALSEKSEILKLNTIREKNNTLDYSERHVSENRDNISFNTNNLSREDKKKIHHIDLTKSGNVTKKDNIDMVNMGYMNMEERRSNIESHDVEFVSREIKSNINPQQKGYEIEAIAINLGINNQNLPKPLTKSLSGPSNMTPAHTHERPHNEISSNQNIPHAHLNHYDTLPIGQTANAFSLNDIEVANKKLFASNNNTSTAPLDYGNWKMSQIRKPDMIPSDYSANSYSSSNDDKLKSDTSVATAINYNKSVQHQQFSNYNHVPRSSTHRNQDAQQNLPAELRIPNPRGLLKADTINTTTSIKDCESLVKNIDAHTKTQKAEKHGQSHPLVSTLPYKTPYSTHSALPIETLRNLPNIPQMLERYTNDERYLTSFGNSSTSLYHDKTFQMAQMFNKNIASEAHHPASTSVSIYSQPSIAAMSKDNNIYKSAVSIASTQMDAKKNKRKRTSDTKQSAGQISQAYHTSTCNNDVLTSVKTNMIPASPYNFGATTNMALSGMYADNGGFTIEDFRNSTNQLMAANYMAAAVAHQQRNNEANAEKLVKPAHQNSNHQSTSSFPFIGHSQVRAAYPFVGAEPSSPLYQQYLQRYQEELQRQTGAQIMGLYPSAYPTPLGVRQPYDSINRPSWL